MLARFMRRLCLAFDVMTGRIVLPHDLEGIVLMAALAKTAAALALLSASADRAIAKAQADSTAASDAAAALAAVDDDTAAQIQAVTDKLDAYAPPMAEGDALDLADASEQQTA